ncbi:MAG: restriction endonuclease subunit S [Desulfuromonadales bacterium]|nr:restriction endonuclease subunit S [Desulfuromonadales bacterium]
MVPEGWEKKEIKDVAAVITGNTPSTKNPEFYDGQIPFVSPADLGRSKRVKKTSKTLTAEGFARSRPIRVGSTLFTCIGSTIGKLGMAGCELATNQQINAVIPNPNMNDHFVYYQLAFRAERIKQFAGTQAVPIINKTTFGSQIISYPRSELEQSKIAQILSTWDKAITTTEQLLSNSRQQKKALMQQLLTGKKRFPGFEGGWKDEYLTSVAQVLVSPVDKKTIEGEKPVRLCNYTDVYYNGRITRKLDFMQATATAREISKFTLRTGDVIITKDSETPGDIAVPAFVSEDLGGVVCGYHLAILRPYEGRVDGEFLSYLLSMPKTRYYFFTLATGATRFGLSVGGIGKAHFNLPLIDEQRQIASVLSSADREIEVLKQEVDNLKQEKNALMQQLLTGKRRVQL